MTMYYVADLSVMRMTEWDAHDIREPVTDEEDEL